MKQFGFYIDSSRCSGCKTCQVTCKDKNHIDVGRKYRRVYEYGGGSWEKVNDAWQNNTFAYYLSISCNHCSEPACVKVCPTGAMQKRKKDGIVLVDENVCIGCRYCEMSCPYGAPQFDTEKNIMTKCDACLDRLQQGLKPTCVESCPQRAIQYGDIDELRRKYGNSCDIAPMPSSELTKPNITVKAHKKAISNKDKIGELQNPLEVKNA